MAKKKRKKIISPAIRRNIRRGLRRYWQSKAGEKRKKELRSFWTAVETRKLPRRGVWWVATPVGVARAVKILPPRKLPPKKKPPKKKPPKKKKPAPPPVKELRAPMGWVDLNTPEWREILSELQQGEKIKTTVLLDSFDEETGETITRRHKVEIEPGDDEIETQRMLNDELRGELEGAEADGIGYDEASLSFAYFDVYGYPAE